MEHKHEPTYGATCTGCHVLARDANRAAMAARSQVEHGASTGPTWPNADTEPVDCWQCGAVVTLSSLSGNGLCVTCSAAADGPEGIDR